MRTIGRCIQAAATSTLVLCATLPAYAQTLITTEAGGHMRLYSPEDGIPSNAAQNGALTSDGYMWVATLGGIVRFDGQEFEEVGQAAGVPTMQQLFYDRRADELWFADADALVHFDGSRFIRYEARDGFVLAGGSRKHIAQIYRDSRGTLWIGTYTPPANTPYNGGVTRFDDGSFSIVDTTQLPLHNAHGFFESSDGTLWISSLGWNRDGFFNADAAVARYDGSQFEVLGEEHGFECQNVALSYYSGRGVSPAIMEDARGHVWFNCRGSLNPQTQERRGYGIYRYDGRTFHRFSEPDGPFGAETIHHHLMYAPQRDELYLSIRKQQGVTWSESVQSVFVFRDGAWQMEEVASSAELASREAEQAANDPLSQGYEFLLASDGSFYAQLTITDQFSSRFRSHVFRNDGGEWTWMDSFDGVLFEEAPGGGFISIHDAPNVIGVYVPSRSRLYTAANGLAQSSPTSGGLFTDRSGRVWISHTQTYGTGVTPAEIRGLSMWDGERLHTFGTRDGLPDVSIETIFQDDAGRLWIPTERGVAVAEERDGRFRIEPIPSAQPTYRATDVTQVEGGDIWAWSAAVNPATGTVPERSFFLARYAGGRLEPHASPYPDSLREMPYQAYEIVPGREGELWMYGRFSASAADLSSADTHIRILEGDAWVEPPPDWGVPETRLYFVGELSGQRYYVVEGGFYTFDGDRFVDLSDSVTADADFRVLKRVNTANMLFHIQGKDHVYIRFRDMGIAAFDGKRLTYFDRRSGLSSVRLLYPSTDRNGDVLFTTPTGGVVFSGTDFFHVKDDAVSDGVPRAIARDVNGAILILYSGLGLSVTVRDTTRHPLRLSSVTLGGREFFGGASPVLTFSENNARIKLASINYLNPEDAKYSYYLEGFDQTWTVPSPSRIVEYRNLPSGRFTLHAKAISAGGVESEPVAYSFRIRPPWWRSGWALGFYAILVAAGVFAVDRVQRRRLVRKEREIARERELEKARELERAYHALEESHRQLRATQAQLVHQQKLASLGALTAGIAHEIKNPLNFVTNFSTLSFELVEELGDLITPMLKRTNGADEGEIRAMLSELKLNAQKITEHGRRADGIVKAMLAHSRGKGGTAEPTDLHRLLDEYVNLAYHGMRAQETGFNVTIERSYDPAIEEVKVVPQDMGRVFINILNNAFQAVHDKRESLRAEGQGDGSSYEPAVAVSTRLVGDEVEIRIRDNGPGMPESIRERIFEPFFTTKAAGSGTGLGLSLSHEIVVEGHGGRLDVESEEGQFTEFILRLPKKGNHT